MNGCVANIELIVGPAGPALDGFVTVGSRSWTAKPVYQINPAGLYVSAVWSIGENKPTRSNLNNLGRSSPEHLSRDQLEGPRVVLEFRSRAGRVVDPLARRKGRPDGALHKLRPWRLNVHRLRSWAEAWRYAKTCTPVEEWQVFPATCTLIKEAGLRITILGRRAREPPRRNGKNPRPCQKEKALAFG